MIGLKGFFKGSYMMEKYETKIQNAFDFICSSITRSVQNGVILGSGLGGLTSAVKVLCTIPYGDIPGFPPTTVQGHRGELIYGKISGKDVLLFNGRYHFYQGYSLFDVTLPVRVAKRIGVQNMIITNASGGINEHFKSGDIMLIKDHINLMGSNPLIGIDTSVFGSSFVDMSDPYDRKLREKIKEIALRNPEIGKLREGTYVAITGPSYETEAEILFLKTIGADAVGMSTVPEVIVCAHEGIRVIGISAVSNMATGMRDNKLTHREVLDSTKKMSRRLTALIRGIVTDVL
jgi:purine-nucleoside phosphorylase